MIINANGWVIAIAWGMAVIVLGSVGLAWHHSRVSGMALLVAVIAVLVVCYFVYLDIVQIAAVRQLQHSGVDSHVRLSVHTHSPSEESAQDAAWLAFRRLNRLGWCRFELSSGKKCTLFLFESRHAAGEGNQNLKTWSRRWLTLIQMKTSSNDISASPAPDAAPRD